MHPAQQGAGVFCTVTFAKYLSPGFPHGTKFGGLLKKFGPGVNKPGYAVKKIVNMKAPFYQRVATSHGGGHPETYFLGSRAASLSDIPHVQIAAVEQRHVFGTVFQYV
jgi:hypothetical protein